MKMEIGNDRSGLAFSDSFRGWDKWKPAVVTLPPQLSALRGVGLRGPSDPIPRLGSGSSELATVIGLQNLSGVRWTPNGSSIPGVPPEGSSKFLSPGAPFFSGAYSDYIGNGLFRPPVPG